MKHFTIRKPEELKQFLASVLGISKGKAKELIDTRNVYVNHQRVWIASHQLQKDDLVEIAAWAGDITRTRAARGQVDKKSPLSAGGSGAVPLNPRDRVLRQTVPAPNRRTLEIATLYEDDEIIAVNKPAGLVSDREPGSVEDLLRRRGHDPQSKTQNPKSEILRSGSCPQTKTVPSPRTEQLRAIHRLDKDTSGVFLLARNDAAFERYKRIWQQHAVEKTYRAICLNPAKFTETEVRLPVEHKSAVSRIRLLRKSAGYSYFEIVTPTGRKHQIRIHMDAIHHPIIGDKQYGPKVIPDPRIREVPRQLLHCFHISITLPGRDRKLEITAPLPEDFRRIGRNLGLIRD